MAKSDAKTVPDEEQTETAGVEASIATGEGTVIKDAKPSISPDELQAKFKEDLDKVTKPLLARVDELERSLNEAHARINNLNARARHWF